MNLRQTKSAHVAKTKATRVGGYLPRAESELQSPFSSDREAAPFITTIMPVNYFESNLGEK